MSVKNQNKLIPLRVILLAMQILLPFALYFTLERQSPVRAWAIAIVFLVNMLAMVGLA
ncbi:MAG: hypothetical protein U9R53_09660 [Chloroflexota bacterium]|nr:hypothetical protein [Chloroflexota bacterium]